MMPHLVAPFLRQTRRVDKYRLYDMPHLTPFSQRPTTTTTSQVPPGEGQMLQHGRVRLNHVPDALPRKLLRVELCNLCSPQTAPKHTCQHAPQNLDLP